MKVSVALATYNGSRFLREQLCSLAGQTLLPSELVVSDDGSSDATVAIVQDFARSAPFPVIVVDKRERLGFSDNFLNAAESCRHELIAFCDQDDVWLPNKLEVSAGRITSDGSLLAMHPLTVTDETLKPTGLHWDQEIRVEKAYEPLELNPYFNGWGNSMTFRRELVHLFPRQRRPQQPERPGSPLSHDQWIYTLAAALGRVSHITAPLLLYRQHGLNAEGVELPKMPPRLVRMGAVPLFQFREKALLYRRFSDLFGELSGADGPFREAAAKAEQRFGERSGRWAARAALFEEPSFTSRLQSYHDHQRLSDPRQPLRGRVKDLVLGVSGLNKVLRRDRS